MQLRASTPRVFGAIKDRFKNQNAIILTKKYEANRVVNEYSDMIGLSSSTPWICKFVNTS